MNLSTSPYNDNTLLTNGIKILEKEAFIFFYARYWKIIISMIIKEGGNVHDAKDIFQRGIISLIEDVQVGKYDTTRGTIGAYFYCKCRFLWRTDRKDSKKKLDKNIPKEEKTDEPSLLDTNLPS